MATVDKINSTDFQACLCLREDNIEFEIQDWKDNIDLGKDLILPEMFTLQFLWLRQFQGRKSHLHSPVDEAQIYFLQSHDS